MKRKTMTSTQSRIELLNALETHQNLTGPTGTPILDESTRTRIPELRTRLITDAGTRNTDYARWREAIEARDRAVENLTGMVRTGWSVLRKRIQTGTLPSGSLTLYGMEPGDRTPNPTTIRAWLEASRQMVAGDEEAESLGFPPLTEPSRETMKDLHQKAEDANRVGEETLTALHESRARLTRTSDEVDDLIQEITLTIRLVTRNQNPIETRKVMRTLGFRFHGEEQAPEETVTETVD